MTWHVRFRKFKLKIKDLEVMIIACFSAAFDSHKTIENCLLAIIGRRNDSTWPFFCGKIAPWVSNLRKIKVLDVKSLFESCYLAKFQ